MGGVSADGPSRAWSNTDRPKELQATYYNIITDTF